MSVDWSKRESAKANESPSKTTIKEIWLSTRHTKMAVEQVVEQAELWQVNNINKYCLYC